MRISRVLKTFLFICLSLGAWMTWKSFYRKEKTDQSSKVKVYKVVKKDLIQRVTIAGNVFPERKTIVTAPFAGYVKKIYVKMGQQVKQNDPIVAVAQSLQSEDPIYPLRAPFDGTIVSIQKQEGEFVKRDNPNEYILRIDSLDNLYINSDVAEIDMVKIRVGHEAIIKTSALFDKKFKGIVEDISLASKLQGNWRGGSKVEYPTKIRILPPYDGIRPGMSAIVDIVTSRKTAIIAVPHHFIFKEDGKFFVFTEKSQKKEVKVGVQNEELFEILEGVKEGDVLNPVDFMNLLETSGT